MTRSYLYRSSTTADSVRRRRVLLRGISLRKSKPRSFDTARRLGVGVRTLRRLEARKRLGSENLQTLRANDQLIQDDQWRELHRHELQGELAGEIGLGSVRGAGRVLLA